MKIKPIVVVALIISLLTSCAAVVLAGAAGGAIVYDRRSISMIEKDARIFHVLHTDIVRDPRFTGSRIIVCSFDQVVLLLGQTPSDSLKALALKKAQEVPNVRRIYNEITVDAPLSIAKRSNDTLITSEVRSHMLTKKGLESGSIRVVTENQIVYLMGIATPEQADLAVNVARQIKGVRKVVKIFQYIR